MRDQFLPLEFYRIDQVARQLGCEIEDILQWGAMGIIEGSLKLFNESSFLSFYRDGNELVDDTTIRNELMSDTVCESRRRAILGSHAKLAEDPQLTVFDGIPLVSASGYWTFDKRFFDDFTLGWQGGELDVELVPAGHDRKGEYASIEPWSLDSGNRRIDPSQIWIIRRDLDRLRELINSAVPQNAPLCYTSEPATEITLIQADMQKPQSTVKRPRTVAFHAANRNRVIAAALKAQELRPTGCYTAVAWADNLLDLANQCFDDGRAGHTLGAITRQIREAIREKKLTLTPTEQ